MSIISATIKFPYQYKTIEFGRIANPKIALPVLIKKGWEELDFLVDSGADTTTFPLELVDQLQADINFKKKTDVVGIEDSKIFGYPGKVQIKIGNLVFAIRCYFIESSVIPLLGRLDIWDKFTIVFDNIKREVVFERI